MSRHLVRSVSCLCLLLTLHAYFAVTFSYAFICLVDPSLKYEGGKHTPLSKLKRKMMDEESRAREGGSDSSVIDSVPISQSLKLPRVAQPSPSGKLVAKDKNVIELDEGCSEGAGSDIEDSNDHGNDDRGSEEGEDNGVNIGSENRSGDDDGGRMGATFPNLVAMARMIMTMMPMIVMAMVAATGVWVPIWRCIPRLRRMRKTMMFQT